MAARDAQEVCAIEFKSATDKQALALHHRDEGKPVVFPFELDQQPCVWSAKVKETSNPEADGEYFNYRVLTKYHYLCSSSLTFNTPVIRVKSEFRGTTMADAQVRVAWTPNLSTSVVTAGLFRVNGSRFQGFDRHSLNINNHFFGQTEYSKRQVDHIYAGNTAGLLEWTQDLRRHKINVRHPWFYSKKPNATAFPLFYADIKDQIEHSFHFRRRVTDHLMCQRRQKKADGTFGAWLWVRVDYDTYLEIGKDDLLPIPTLTCNYAKVPPESIRNLLACKEPFSQWIHDMVDCDTLKAETYDSPIVSTVTCVDPAMGMFWVAENQTAVANHYYSNYTTNATDHVNGENPCFRHSFQIGDKFKWKDEPSDRFAVDEPRDHARTNLCEEGYHMHAWADMVDCRDADVGIILAGMAAKLTVLLKEDDRLSLDDGIGLTLPPAEEDYADPREAAAARAARAASPIANGVPAVKEAPKDMFKLIVRLDVLRRYSIFYEGTGKDGKWVYAIYPGELNSGIRPLTAQEAASGLSN